MATDQAFKLGSRLTGDSVPAVHAASRVACRLGRLPECIDLSELQQVDSAGLALLLEWQAQARAAGRQIEFANPPESLRVLAELSQADTLLGWSPA